MLKRFFIAKSFRFHISKPKKIPGNIFVDIISKVGKASRRGIWGSQNSKIFKTGVGKTGVRKLPNLACLVKRVCVHDLVSVPDVPQKPSISASNCGFCETPW